MDLTKNQKKYTYTQSEKSQSKLIQEIDKNNDEITSECREKYLERVYGMSAKYLLLPSFIKNGKQIIELAKNDKTAIKNNIFKGTISYVPILDNAEKYALVRDLQISLKYFYNDIFNGRKDETIKTFMNLIQDCFNSTETYKDLIAGQYAISNNLSFTDIIDNLLIEEDDLEKGKEIYLKNIKNKALENIYKINVNFLPVYILDKDIAKKYFLYRGPRYTMGLKTKEEFYAESDGFYLEMNINKFSCASPEEVEAIELDPKLNFRQYATVLYLVVNYGKEWGLEAENAIIRAMFFPKTYYAMTHATQGMIQSLPTCVKKAKSVYDICNIMDIPNDSYPESDLMEFVHKPLFDILKEINIELNKNRLYKNDVTAVLRTLGVMKESMMNCMEMSEEDADRYICVIAPYVFALYTIGLDYKKTTTMIESEKQVYVKQEKEPSKKETSAETVLGLQKDIENKSKELKEVSSVSQSRKEKIQKLEGRISVLEEQIEVLKNEKASMQNKIDELNEETDRLVDTLISSGIEFDEEELGDILETEDINKLFDNDLLREGEEELEGGEQKDYCSLLEGVSNDYRILLAGCPKYIMKKFGERHPNIKCTFGNEGKTLEQTFKGADIIFVRTSSISHQQCHQILAVNRNVHYINKINNIDALEKEMYEHIADRYSLEEEEEMEYEL